MWTVIYMAKNLDMAKKIKELLEGNKIPVKVRPTGNGPECCYEVLVPAAEVEGAHGIIIGTD